MPTLGTVAGAAGLIPFNFGAVTVANFEHSKTLQQDPKAPSPALLKAGNFVQSLSFIALLAFSVLLVAMPAFSFMLIPFAIAVAAYSVLSALTLTAYAIYNRDANCKIITPIATTLLWAGLVAGLVFVAPIAVPIIILGGAGLGIYSCSSAGSSLSSLGNRQMVTEIFNSDRLVMTNERPLNPIPAKPAVENQVDDESEEPGQPRNKTSPLAIPLTIEEVDNSKS